MTLIIQRAGAAATLNTSILEVHESEARSDSYRTYSLNNSCGFPLSLQANTWIID